MDRDIQRIKRTLESLGVRPSKGRGQNFLFDPVWCEEIAQFAGLGSNDMVLEIGPGLGPLTAALLRRVRELHLLEIEEEFCRYLKREFPQLGESQIHHSDFRRFDLSQLERGDEKLLLVSNVPYSVSTGLITWFLENRSYFKRASLLLQREFAERVAAVPGTRAYGALSVYCQLYADCELGLIIPGTAFYPEAAVESRLLALRILPEPRIKVGDEARFLKFVHACFASKRKTLANSLFGAGEFANKSDAAEFLRRSEVDPNRRAETLSLAEFGRLFESL